MSTSEPVRGVDDMKHGTIFTLNYGLVSHLMGLFTFSSSAVQKYLKSGKSTDYDILSKLGLSLGGSALSTLKEVIMQLSDGSNGVITPFHDLYLNIALSASLPESALWIVEADPVKYIMVRGKDVIPIFYHCGYVCSALKLWNRAEFWYTLALHVPIMNNSPLVYSKLQTYSWIDLNLISFITTGACATAPSTNLLPRSITQNIINSINFHISKTALVEALSAPADQQKEEDISPEHGSKTTPISIPPQSRGLADQAIRSLQLSAFKRVGQMYSKLTLTDLHLQLTQQGFEGDQTACVKSLVEATNKGLVSAQVDLHEGVVCFA